MVFGISLNDPFIIRNFTYGVEDSLISTCGMVVGVASAGFTTQMILIAGLILILVEASSMAFGAFLSEENFLLTAQQNYTTIQLLIYTLVMFVSYIVAGLIPLAPFLLNIKHPRLVSIGLSIVALFMLVYMTQANLFNAFALTFIGSLIMIVSIGVGSFIQRMKNNSLSK